MNKSRGMRRNNKKKSEIEKTVAKSLNVKRKTMARIYFHVLWIVGLFRSIVFKSKRIGNLNKFVSTANRSIEWLIFISSISAIWDIRRFIVVHGIFRPWVAPFVFNVSIVAVFSFFLLLYLFKKKIHCPFTSRNENQ